MIQISCLKRGDNKFKLSLVKQSFYNSFIKNN